MAAPAFTQVASVEVEKLFGLYDHTIGLNVGDRVTIVHGPNDVGKTWVLRLLAALFSGGISAFCRVPMKRFEVVLTDGSSIAVVPRPGRSGPRKSRRRPLEIVYREPGTDPHAAMVDFDDPRLAETLMMLGRESPWLERVGEDQWMD